VPRFRHGYTVNRLIAGELNKIYGVNYETIRNVPYKIETGSLQFNPDQNEKFILYQGAVNEGRSFETLIPAFNSINANLVVCGNGNFMQQAIQLVKENNLENKIQFTGWVSPDVFKIIHPQSIHWCKHYRKQRPQQHSITFPTVFLITYNPHYHRYA
jgi:glycosyltransferase involved in cell wall biosynthesis